MLQRGDSGANDFIGLVCIEEVVTYSLVCLDRLGGDLANFFLHEVLHVKIALFAVVGADYVFTEPSKTGVFRIAEGVIPQFFNVTDIGPSLLDTFQVRFILRSFGGSGDKCKLHDQNTYNKNCKELFHTVAPFFILLRLCVQPSISHFLF